MQRERRRDMWNSFSLSPSSYDPVSALIRRESLGGKNCSPSFIARFWFIIIFPQRWWHILLICARWRWRQSVLGFLALSSQSLGNVSVRSLTRGNTRSCSFQFSGLHFSFQMCSSILVKCARVYHCLCALHRQAPRGPYLFIGCDIRESFQMKMGTLVSQ